MLRVYVPYIQASIESYCIHGLVYSPVLDILNGIILILHSN